MKLYYVSYGNRIAGSYDYCYVMAENEMDAIAKADKMLDKHKLNPNFLNQNSRYFIKEA